MRWPVFVIFGLLAVAIDTSLAGVFTLHSLGAIQPCLSACVVTFVALFAPRHTAIWACWLLGLMVDLCPLPLGPMRMLTLIGPNALGYAFAAFLVTQLRPMLFRRSLLTIALMTFVSYLAASLVVVAIFAVRRWYPEDPLHWTDFSAGGELLRRVGIAAYSFVIALPLGWVLLTLSPLWGFQTTTQRAGGWR